jgi:dTDP-4-amino-4,6-dideoxygalactose transaminase
MFVLNPDPYLMPSYRISPFTTSSIETNHQLPDDDYIDSYFSERFSGKQYLYTINGREAINIALSYFNLQKEDVVTILTTTGNFYISQCVTNEISKFCNWSRQIEQETKIILVNHEFGFPYNEIGQLRKLKIPIIEDCAHSFFSKGINNDIGNVGDFVIYSFPKMFPLQIGGLLVANYDFVLPKSGLLENMGMRYIKNVLSWHIKDLDEIIKRRLANYSFLAREFAELGFAERFNLTDGVVPGVFMFRTDDQKNELPELKKHFYTHGIQCSVFYGENTFFVPVHQNLSTVDCQYIIAVFKKFLL